MQETVAIIGALEKEVRLIKGAIEGAQVSEEAGLSVVAGEFAGVRVVATTAGMGTVNVAAATQHLISRYGAGTVIFSGIAGGLNPALHISDVVIGERLRYLDTDTALIAESAPGLEEFVSALELVAVAEEVLRERGYAEAGAAACDACAEQAEGENKSTASAQPLQYLRGTIATGDRFVTGEAMRAAAIEATHADCVEMEGAAVAHVAAKNGVRSLVLRAISDNCDEAYDAFCEREFDLDEYAEQASSLTLEIVRRIASA